MQIRPIPFLALGGLFEADDVAAAANVIEAAATTNGNFFPLPEENTFQQGLAAHAWSSPTSIRARSVLIRWPSAPRSPTAPRRSSPFTSPVIRPTSTPSMR